MAVTWKDCTVSIEGVRVIGSFKMEQLITPLDFTQERVQLRSGVQQLEALPRRERNWLAGYLEIREKIHLRVLAPHELKKLNNPRRMPGYPTCYPTSMWRRLEYAAVTFFDGRCVGKVRHIKRLAVSMVWSLVDLSGDSFWDIVENMNAFQVVFGPTPADWNTIWTGE